jgi:hypothetical protein
MLLFMAMTMTMTIADIIYATIYDNDDYYDNSILA